MAGPVHKTIYELEIRGSDVVIKGYANVAEQAGATQARIANSNKKTAKSTEQVVESVKPLHESIGDLGGAFQSVSRDIGAVGGKIAETFSKAADDVLGVLSALGEGGVRGYAAAASIAVGWIATAYDELVVTAEEAAEAAKKAAEITKKAAEEEKKEIDAVVKSLQGKYRVFTDIEIAAANERSRRSKAAIDDLTTEMEEDRKIWNDKTRRLSETEEARARYHKNEELRKTEIAKWTEAGAQLDQAAKSQAKQARREVLIEEINAHKEKTKGIEEIGKAFRNQFIDWKDANAEMARTAQKEGKEVVDIISGISEASGKELDAIKAVNEAFAKQFRSWDVAVEKQDKARKTDVDVIKMTGELTKASDAYAFAKMKETREFERSTKIKAMDAAGNVAYGVSMMALSSSVSFATSQLQQFGDINAINYRDMLTINENTVASFAKAAQAAIFNTGIKAGSEAAFQGAEAIKELAAGFGYLATPGAQASAVMSFKSAGLHAAAATAYGALGGALIGTSLGIGALRGSVIGTGESGTAISTSALPSSSGGGYGSGRGSVGGPSEGEGQTVINFNYNAGSMNAADERAMARAVAKGARSARSNGFLRRAYA